MRLKSSILIVIFLVSVSASRVGAQTDAIPTLTYDELYEKRADYAGKVVRVKAFHLYGFEWSVICGAKCLHSNARIWVDFINDDDLCKGSKRKLRTGSDHHFDNRGEVIYVGKLSSGQFGHMGAYPYQLMVTCVERFKRMRPLS